MVLSWPVNVLRKYLYFGLKAESLSQRLEPLEQKHDDLVIKVSSQVGFTLAVRVLLPLSSKGAQGY
jgi:hypothetical protein